MGFERLRWFTNVKVAGACSGGFCCRRGPGQRHGGQHRPGQPTGLRPGQGHGRPRRGQRQCQEGKYRLRQLALLTLRKNFSKNYNTMKETDTD